MSILLHHDLDTMMRDAPEMGPRKDDGLENAYRSHHTLDRMIESREGYASIPSYVERRWITSRSLKSLCHEVLV